MGLKYHSFDHLTESQSNPVYDKGEVCNGIIFFRFNFEDHHLEFSNQVQDRLIGTKDETANVSFNFT